MSNKTWFNCAHNRKEFELKNRKSAPLTIKQLEKHARGRRSLLTFCIRHIPFQCSWREESAVFANACLLSPVFERVNIEFDASRFETAISTIETDADKGIQAYGNLLSILKTNTGLDLMGNSVAKRHSATHVQLSLTRAFGILALAWVLSAQEARANIAGEASLEGEACSTSQ
ncbi:MAG: hypothetical protein WCW31_04140 [Patescibacteria group bacterium]